MRQNHPLLRSALLLTGVHLLLRCLSVWFGTVLSARLGAGGMGLLQLVGSVGAFAAALGTAGLRTGCTILCAAETGARRPGGVLSALRACLAYGLLLSVSAGALLFAFSVPLAAGLLHSAAAAPALRLMALSLPSGCLCAVFSGCCAACGRIRRLAALELGEELLCLALTLALLPGARGDAPRACSAVLLAGLLAELAGTAVSALLLRRDFGGAAPSAPGFLPGRRLLRLCGPLWLSECLRAALSAAEQLLIPWGLVRAGGTREAALAAYGLVRGMVFPILLLPAALLGAAAELLVPELARCRAAGQAARVRSLSRRALAGGAVYALCSFFLLFFAAEPLGRLLYGSEAAGAWLRVFAPTVLVLYPDILADGINTGLGRQAACARLHLFISVLDVLLLRLLLPCAGMGGYYASFAVTRLLGCVLGLRLVHRTVPLTLPLSRPTMRGKLLKEGPKP